jgi:threonine dehydratase
MKLPTPLEPAPPALAPAREVWLKREDVHELGAFKWRGALPALESFRARGADAVVTASTGNHGAATAWAAGRVGLTAFVFAPLEASPVKLAHVEPLGGTLRLVGADLDEAKDEARSFANVRGLPFFEDGAEPAQYAGYAAIGHEILDQARVEPRVVVVPVGNGALIAGIGRALAERSSGSLCIGVVAKEAPVMALSWRARRPVECDRCATFADGLATRVAVPRAVAELDDVVDRMLEVSERELAWAVGAFAAAGIRAEGAAAAALAALPQLADVEGPIVLVVTGRNIDDALFARCVDSPESFSD